MHVGRLRRKLGTAGQPIETVFGLGYRFIDSRGFHIDVVQAFRPAVSGGPEGPHYNNVKML